MLQINKSLTEEEIIAGCRKGKAAAQRKLYDRLAPKMLGVATRYVSDREEAEHIMIGSLIKVFEKLDQYTGEGSFEGWVRRIVVNDCLMYLRKNKTMSLDLEIGPEGNSPNLHVMEDQLEATDLINMIDGLPVGYKTVFNLFAIEGYSHAEISEMLGISENTSKSQLSRARKWLQKRLLAIESEIETTRTNGSTKN